MPAFFILASCNITKRVENNELLLVKNKIDVKGKLNAEIENELSNFYKQKPNERFLGFLFKDKLYFFNMGSGGKKDNAIKRFLRDKLGEPPVLIDTVYIESTVRTIKSYLRTKGHYYADVKFEVVPYRFNKKKGKVIYKVIPGNYYHFQNYELNIADREIYNIVKPTMGNTFIVFGNRLDEEQMLKEQERIVNLMRNNGYYSFTKEFVDFDLDTSAGNWFTYVALNIKNKNDYEQHKKYLINNVTIEVDKNNESTLSTVRDTIIAKGFNYIPHTYQLNPMILSHNLFLFPNDTFRQLNYSSTYGRLSQLNIFKFINISAKLNDSNDVGKIDYNIKLIPSVKYNYVLEPQVITSDQSNNLYESSFRSYGIAASLQFNNRNVFKNAELLQLSYRSAFEAQGTISGNSLFNATEQSLSASVTIPHTLFIPAFDRNVNILNAKSIVNTSLIYEINRDYDRKVGTVGLNYLFNRKMITYYYSPIEFSYINTSMIDTNLIKRSKTDLFLKNLFTPNVIMDARFGFTYSNKSIAKGHNYYLLKWDAIEIAGNVLTAANTALGSAKTSDGHYDFLGVNYSQYIKSAIDFRYNKIIDKNNSSVFRIFTGIISPFGNSPDYTPFEKRFYVGGANSLRAWSPRSLGPGSYQGTNMIDHSGDLKIELNAEYRFNIYNQWLEGVLFGDAGNIWLLKKDVAKPGADFDMNRFYQEFAVDAGFGIRLNFSIVLIRLDIGIPIYNPTNYENPTLEAQNFYNLTGIPIKFDQRWMIKDFNTEWLLKKPVFNFGIGYPF